MFVDTFLEETDIKKREENRKMLFQKLHTIKATPQQQKDYKDNIERVVREQQTANIAENNSQTKKLGSGLKQSFGIPKKITK